MLNGDTEQCVCESFCSELSQQFEQLLYNIQMILGNTHPDLSSDLKQLTSEALKRQTRLVSSSDIAVSGNQSH